MNGKLESELLLDLLVLKFVCFHNCSRPEWRRELNICGNFSTILTYLSPMRSFAWTLSKHVRSRLFPSSGPHHYQHRTYSVTYEHLVTRRHFCK